MKFYFDGLKSQIENVREKIRECRGWGKRSDGIAPDHENRQHCHMEYFVCVHLAIHSSNEILVILKTKTIVS